MRDDLSKFNKAGASIVVVGKHTTEQMNNFWKKNKLPFTGIPDPERGLANLYKQQFKALKLGTMPAMFVVNKDGKITFLHYSSSMSDIPANAAVLDEVKKLKNQ